MKVNQIKSSLQQLKKIFQDILEDDANSVIDEVIGNLEKSKNKFDEWTKRADNPSLIPQPWGYRIYPERPLRFIQSRAIGGLNLWVDLYCKVLWEEEGKIPVEQDI